MRKKMIHTQQNSLKYSNLTEGEIIQIFRYLNEKNTYPEYRYYLEFCCSRLHFPDRSEPKTV